MRYVAINTAGPVIEIAVSYDDMSLYRKLRKVMAAEQLLPQIDEMLSEAGVKLADFDAFVCVVGPGSFTGIRIGVVVARTLGYALGKDVYGVTYNRVMAYNAMCRGRIVTAADGGGGTCYVAATEGDEAEEAKCIYKKDLPEFARGCERVIADFEAEGTIMYSPDGTSLMRAAEYAIENKCGTEPVYIRKPQPDRKGDDL